MPQPSQKFADPKEVNTHIIGKVKEGRVIISQTIDFLEALRKIANEGVGGREFSLSITKLQEAKHWLGEALGALGQQLPPEYRDDGKQK